MICCYLLDCVFFWVFVYVFFCKQKTAYEMRISDWSSDVCSSDLEVDGVLLQRLARLLGVLVLDLLAAAHVVDRGFKPRLVGAGGLERAPGFALVVERGEHEQLRRDERVATLLRELVGDVEQARQVVADRNLPVLPGHLRDRKST